MTIPHPIALCFYGVGIVISPPIWYLMITKQFLHTNFRTLIFIITLGAFFVCVLTYVDFLGERLGYKNEVFDEYILKTVRHFGALYYSGNLLLCIERAVAVVKVSQYERYVSPAITASIILFALSASAIVGAILNALVKVYGHPPLLGFVVFYSALCSLIAISLYVYRKTSKKMVFSYSLQKKYQDKENRRTAAVYTFISLNELLSTLTSAGFHALMEEANKNKDVPASRLYYNCIDLIDSYRVLFVNVTILLNCFLWSRHQRKIFIEKQTNQGDQYFIQLQSSWKMA
ncbi:hypothetical protein Aduo_010685 [Ancylostoma duodenale]